MSKNYFWNLKKFAEKVTWLFFNPKEDEIFMICKRLEDQFGFLNYFNFNSYGRFLEKYISWKKIFSKQNLVREKGSVENFNSNLILLEEGFEILCILARRLKSLAGLFKVQILPDFAICRSFWQVQQTGL